VVAVKFSLPAAQKENGSIYVEVCSVCHPFYTGKQRILDTGGRVAKFQERFGKADKSGTK
jgi:large subunit ribosomal protein L31